MKFSLTLLFLSLGVLTVAQANSELKDAVNRVADAPVPPNVKLPIPSNVNERRKPALEAAQNRLPKPSTPIASCKYSCPLRDTSGTPLVKKRSAFGWDFDGYFVNETIGKMGKGKGETKGKGWYDVFECVYNLASLESKEHTCSYYKHDGTHALGYPGDKCPSQAPSCPLSPPAVPKLGLAVDEDEAYDEESTPHFSSSQLDGAELIDPVRGVYRYKDTMETPPWIMEGRYNVYLKEHPPVKLN